jgi:hypothetical protein
MSGALELGKQDSPSEYSDLHFATDRLEGKPCPSFSSPAKSFSPNRSEGYCDPRRFPYAKARSTFLP